MEYYEEVKKIHVYVLKWNNPQELGTLKMQYRE
jgi:hypothetical protein